LKALIFLIMLIFLLDAETSICEHASIKEKINLFDLCGESVLVESKFYLTDYPEFSLPEIKNYSTDVLNAYQEIQGHQKVPFICCGDFDGNGRVDIAAILEKRNHKGSLVIFQQLRNNKYKKVILEDNIDYVYNVFITIHPKESVIEGWDDPAIPESMGIVTLKTEGIEFGEFFSWAVLYYWDRNNYKKLVISD